MTLDLSRWNFDNKCWNKHSQLKGVNYDCSDYKFANLSIKEIKNKIIFESLSRIKITEDLHRCSFNIASVILKMVICCIIELQFFESPLFLYFNLW